MLISRYISYEEFRCSHCHALPPDLVKDDEGEWPTIYLALFDRFEDLRESWGKPIPITSGYRCPAHELNVSGKGISVHLFGLALDLAVDPQGFAALVEREFPELRMGTYADGHIHIDVGYLISPRYSTDLIEGARWKA